MTITGTIKETTVKAKALAGVAGKKVVGRLAEAGDAALIKLGERARKRKRTRALKAVGQAVLVTGAAAATLLAGRAVMKQRGKSR